MVENLESCRTEKEFVEIMKAIVFNYTHENIK